MTTALDNIWMNLYTDAIAMVLYFWQLVPACLGCPEQRARTLWIVVLIQRRLQVCDNEVE